MLDEDADKNVDDEDAERLLYNGLYSDDKQREQFHEGLSLDIERAKSSATGPDSPRFVERNTEV